MLICDEFYVNSVNTSQQNSLLLLQIRSHGVGLCCLVQRFYV